MISIGHSAKFVELKWPATQSRPLLPKYQWQSHIRSDHESDEQKEWHKCGHQYGRTDQVDRPLRPVIRHLLEGYIDPYKRGTNCFLQFGLRAPRTYRRRLYSHALGKIFDTD